MAFLYYLSTVIFIQFLATCIINHPSDQSNFDGALLCFHTRGTRDERVANYVLHVTLFKEIVLLPPC